MELWFNQPFSILNSKIKLKTILELHEITRKNLILPKRKENVKIKNKNGLSFKYTNYSLNYDQKIVCIRNRKCIEIFSLQEHVRK